MKRRVSQEERAMSRAGRYDDLSDNKVSRKGNSSSRLLFAVILISILICAIAVLCWVKIIETQEVAGAGREADSSAAEAVHTPSAQDAASEEGIKAPTVSDKLGDAARMDLDIETALASLHPSDNPGTDYISSGDFPPAGDSGSAVVEESIEMKKPVIAQNLSRTQQPAFSKDLVKWQEYTIKYGDSLPDIAQSFGLDVQTLISVNQIKSTASLWVGSSLRIPDRDGTLYIVREGDTLASIVSQFSLGISARTLGDVNGIMDDNLTEGQELFIPYDTIDSQPAPVSALEISIPEGMAVGMYNQRVTDPLGNGTIQLDGILIQNDAGSPVLAAEAGSVVDKGFNENGTGFVKIVHANGYTTYYDYLGDITVESAETVEKGQQIGVYVQTENSNPIIFFRVEQGGVAFDPYSF